MKISAFCRVSGCQNKVHVFATGRRTLCTTHYGRRQLLGSEYAVIRRRANGTGNLTQHGYHRIEKNGVSKFVHRLIWEAHNGPIPKNHCIHHVDGDKLNNTLSNLQCMSWANHQSLHRNMSHA